jgi:hypothetical protein
MMMRERKIHLSGVVDLALMKRISPFQRMTFLPRNGKPSRLRWKRPKKMLPRQLKRISTPPRSAALILPLSRSGSVNQSAVNLGLVETKPPVAPPDSSRTVEEHYCHPICLRLSRAD